MTVAELIEELTKLSQPDAQVVTIDSQCCGCSAITEDVAVYCDGETVRIGD